MAIRAPDGANKGFKHIRDGSEGDFAQLDFLSSCP